MSRQKAVFAARVLGLGLALLITGGSARAQINISGSIYDGNGGPLLSGVVYHVTGSGIAVPFGQTLTVLPGAIVKFNANLVSLSGTLDVNGTGLAPVVFTSIQDDSAGGDTNGNGPSAGSPGDWQGIHVFGNSNLDAEHAAMRYAGSTSWAPVYGNGGTITLRNSTISDSAGPGIELNGRGAATTIEDCSLDDNATYPIQGATIDEIAGFSNNTASGNGSADCILVSGASPTADVTIGAGQCINDVLIFANSCTVPSGVTLTLEAGVTIKWNLVALVFIDGSLVLAGTESSPVVMTTLADDDYSGDTNKDGPSSGSPGEWYGITVRATGTIDIDHAVVRYAGAFGAVPIFGQGGAITLRNSTISDSLGAGIDLSNLDLVPTIEGCSIDDNGTYAVQNAAIDAIPGFVNNTASGNGSGDYILLTDTSPSADVTIRAKNCMNGALVFAASGRIGPGITLTLKRGVVVKWSGAHWLDVSGGLNIEGAKRRPVVMTSLADDDHVGDTNGDGPSSGSPGDWYGLWLRSTGVPVIDRAVLRYAGAGGWAPIYNQDLSGSLTMRNTELRDSQGAGIDLNNYDIAATIEECSFDDNGTYAVRDVSIDSIPGFANNTATGNGAGDYIYVTDGQLTGNVTIGPESCLEGALVFASSQTIPTETSLTLQAGVVVKFATQSAITVNGSLDLEGTAFHPVVLTSLDDDQVAGDTNGDGPSTGSPGDWLGIYFSNSATTSRVENALLRYGGLSSLPGIRCDSGLVSIRSARIEHSAGDGFFVSAHSGDAMNWVAFDCAGEGIELTAGSFDILHATSASNGGYGIMAGVGHSGDVVNSIAWGNTLGNFSGYVAGEVGFSDGSALLAGANGNINLDPLFVDPSSSVGDLLLQASSPCVDTANVATASSVVKDHAEHSRMLDPTLSGTLRPDMGAYERHVWSMTAQGEPRSRSWMDFTVQGPTGTSLYLFGLLDGHLFLSPFGFVTCGTTSLTMLATVPVGSTYSLRIPPERSLIGLGFGVQTHTLPTGSTTVGAITNLYRDLIQPPRAKARTVEEPLRPASKSVL